MELCQRAAAAESTGASDAVQPCQTWVAADGNGPGMGRWICVSPNACDQDNLWQTALVLVVTQHGLPVMRTIAGDQPGVDLQIDVLGQRSTVTTAEKYVDALCMVSGGRGNRSHMTTGPEIDVDCRGLQEREQRTCAFDGSESLWMIQGQCGLGLQAEPNGIRLPKSGRASSAPDASIHHTQIDGTHHFPGTH